MSLIYENGKLVLGATRGDGEVGEDVTNNVKTIRTVPLKIANDDQLKESLRKNKIEYLFSEIKKTMNKRIEVRGEVIIEKKEFEKINKSQQAKGLMMYANPRNLAAGSIRQLNPNVTRERKLIFISHNLVTDFGQNKHSEAHYILEALGFKTITKQIKISFGLKDIFAFMTELF